jgi:hypothetical protein
LLTSGRAVLHAPELATYTRSLRRGLRPPGKPEPEYGGLIYVSSQPRKYIKNSEFSRESDPADASLPRLPAVALKTAPRQECSAGRPRRESNGWRAKHSRLRHIPGCGTDLQLSADIGMQLSADIGIQPSADVEGFSSSIRCITVWWQEGIALPG